MDTDVAIIGGGAAGFFAAVNIAQKAPGTGIILLEKSTKLLSKVKVSGGGRCNVTHDCTDASELVKNYPRGSRELRQGFARFAVPDTIGWFHRNGVLLKTEPDGRMFPITDSSDTIVDCFLKLSAKHQVQIVTAADVQSILPSQSGFLLKTSAGNVSARFVVCAAGGHPKEGAYEYIRQLGHSIVKPVPSLFTFNLPGDTLCRLPGISVQNAGVRLSELKLQSRGPLLITHWGVSGPAVLRLSAFGALGLSEKSYETRVEFNWTRFDKEQEVFESLLAMKSTAAKSQLKSRSPFELPSRLWEYLLSRAQVSPETVWAECGKQSLGALARTAFRDLHQMKGKTTFKEEFVTCGGVKLSEIDFRTMESKIVPGVYFCGEVLNIDGITGGFNFQAAWTTAWVAAQHIAEKLKEST